VANNLLVSKLPVNTQLM